VGTALTAPPAHRGPRRPRRGPTVIVSGTIQVLLGVLGVARLMRFVPRSVMVGFVNALAILNKGKHVTIVGMNDASAERHERLAGHLGGGH
jgi:hypothetical protein